MCPNRADRETCEIHNLLGIEGWEKVPSFYDSNLLEGAEGPPACRTAITWPGWSEMQLKDLGACHWLD